MCSFTAGADYVGASQDFAIDSSVAETQVCLSVMSLEDELVEETETVAVTATGVTGGISLTGSPATLQIHSRECESTAAKHTNTPLETTIT